MRNAGLPTGGWGAAPGDALDWRATRRDFGADAPGGREMPHPEPPEGAVPDPARDTVGLCRTCAHARQVETPRSRFWLCRRSASDPTFERYPRLPVRECRGWEPREDGAPAE